MVTWMNPAFFLCACRRTTRLAIWNYSLKWRWSLMLDLNFICFPYISLYILMSISSLRMSEFSYTLTVHY